MREQIKKQLTKIIISHTFIAFCLRILFDCSLWKTLLLLYFWSMVIAGSMWLSERYNKPAIWQGLMIILGGAGASFLLGWGVNELLANEEGLLIACKEVS